MDKKLKGCLLVFSALLVMGILIMRFNYYSKPDTAGPANYAELCRSLGRDLNDGPTCNDLTIYQLLLDEFPPGIATREEVHNQLGVYFLQSSERPVGGYVDSYAIQRVSFGVPKIAQFEYHEDEVLFYIGMTD